MLSRLRENILSLLCTSLPKELSAYKRTTVTVRKAQLDPRCHYGCTRDSPHPPSCRWPQAPAAPARSRCPCLRAAA